MIDTMHYYVRISIHAPSRERPKKHFKDCWRNQYFNPRSLAGATTTANTDSHIAVNFNPRSLAGATQ